MSIRFTCANAECGRDVVAPDGSAGRKARCPYCGEVQTIPVVEPAGADPFSAEGAPAAPARTSRARPVKGGEAVQSCPVCGTVYPAGQACPRCRQHRKSYARESRDVGRFVKIGLLLAGIAAVVVAIAWGIHAYKPKPGSKTYLDGVFGAKHMAESTVSMNNLRLIRDALERYREGFGEYPPYLKDLLDNGLIPSPALYTPDRQKQAYKYIRGQDPEMPGDNILVYEEKPIHRDKCNVLRLDGRLGRLTPEELEKAVEATRRIVGED